MLVNLIFITCKPLELFCQLLFWVCQPSEDSVEF